MFFGWFISYLFLHWPVYPRRCAAPKIRMRSQKEHTWNTQGLNAGFFYLKISITFRALFRKRKRESTTQLVLIFASLSLLLFTRKPIRAFVKVEKLQLRRSLKTVKLQFSMTPPGSVDLKC